MVGGLNRKKLTPAFDALLGLGYFAKQNWYCCQSCGCAAVPEMFDKKYVFYHEQDYENMKEKGVVWLAWAGDGKEICKVFQLAGFTTEWDGSPGRRIKVSPRITDPDEIIKLVKSGG